MSFFLFMNRGDCTWVGIGDEGENSVRDTEHQAFGVDGLAGVGALIRLFHVADGECAAAVLTDHTDPGNTGEIYTSISTLL